MLIVIAAQSRAKKTRRILHGIREKVEKKNDEKKEKKRVKRKWNRKEKKENRGKVKRRWRAIKSEANTTKIVSGRKKNLPLHPLWCTTMVRFLR